MTTYVIVGGVAGGATTAARLRRRDEEARIIMLERGKYVSFANCGLPYHIGETIPERESLLVSTPEELEAEFDIDVRTQHEVVAIDREAKQVQVRDLARSETYTLAYDKLILSPGAKPLVPPIPGADLKGVFTLRDMPDMDVIKSHVDQGGAQSAVIVGGGFIGLEIAENLVKRGLTVTIVEMLDQVMAALDYDMAAFLHEHLRDQGVRLGLGDAVAEIRPRDDGQLFVQLKSGRGVAADMVLLSIGVRPENKLAQDAGLELGPRGHIVVNQHMQTSDPDVYAVGDAVQVLNPITHKPTAIPLAGPANRQARIAADHITGLGSAYQGTLGTSIVKVFELTAATTGMNSTALEREGMAFASSITHSSDHVGYYPGSTRQSIKLLYAPEDGRLLGAQVVGYNAVDRTIDVLATALKAGMTVYDLEHLELAYAPPYGAAKDPVNIAGYVAGNRLRGDSDLVEWREVANRDPEKLGVLDVRTQIEWDLGHIEGAVHIPNTELRQRLGELSKEKDWVIYCAVGRRAYVAERILKQNSFRARNLTGGWTTYQVATEKQDNFGDWVPEAPSGGDQMREFLAATQAGSGNGSPESVALTADAELNACGLQCPGPILAVYKKMQELEAGQVLEVTASDPGFRRDVGAWAERTGHALLHVEGNNGTVRALLRKGSEKPQIQVSAQGTLPTDKTMVVFSADLDRALASFIIANGAAAMGQKVTMFFTFWGLNILRRNQAQPVQKNLIERMFGWMLPKGPNALKLSRLNMGGLGTAMMKMVMRSKNIDSLPRLMETAMQNGVRLVACQMTMDMMGIKQEELIDGVELGGVATYINETDKASATLFI
ncbi:MAG: FAD-dependent oxidoreductase [Anaerolineae bacterium]|nr:FAD-dependent oxidoreductase [Anaerolineae bacterium]